MLLRIQFRQRTSLRHLLCDKHIATPSGGNFSSQRKLSIVFTAFSQKLAFFFSQSDRSIGDSMKPPRYRLPHS